MTRTVTRTVTTTDTSSRSTQAAACKGSQLSGTFAEVPGSGAAGSISYALTLTNQAPEPCSLAGVPEVQLVAASGDELQTRATGAPGASSAAVVLESGRSAKAEARFSPTVAPCNPTRADSLRVTAPGGGTVDVPFDPPTPVCNGGAMVWSAFSRN